MVLQRVIRTMLFADVVGYSGLQETQVPFFMHEFLARVSAALDNLPGQPELVNTWGDALFAVMDSAGPLAEYALALQRVVTGTDWSACGLPAGLNVRIALHAGPAFAGRDPFTERPNLYGTQVNRTARLEPVTAPGQVYATEQFVALLLAEQGVESGRVAYEYVGNLALAKRFGRQAIYHLYAR